MNEDIITFKNLFTWNLQMLKFARKSVVSIATIKCTSNARFTSDMAFDSAAPVKTCSTIGGMDKNSEKRLERKAKGKEEEKK